MSHGQAAHAYYGDESIPQLSRRGPLTEFLVSYDYDLCMSNKLHLVYFFRSFATYGTMVPICLVPGDIVRMKFTNNC